MRGLEDRAGYVHRLLAYAVIALAVVHSLAALKHHFFDKSKIMTRMWAGPPSSNVLTSEKEDHL
jgi:cytochrome b561